MRTRHAGMRMVHCQHYIERSLLSLDAAMSSAAATMSVRVRLGHWTLGYGTDGSGHLRVAADVQATLEHLLHEVGQYACCLPDRCSHR